MPNWNASPELLKLKDEDFLAQLSTVDHLNGVIVFDALDRVILQGLAAFVPCPPAEYQGHVFENIITAPLRDPTWRKILEGLMPKLDEASVDCVMTLKGVRHSWEDEERRLHRAMSHNGVTVPLFDLVLERDAIELS